MFGTLTAPGAVHTSPHKPTRGSSACLTLCLVLCALQVTRGGGQVLDTFETLLGKTVEVCYSLVDSTGKCNSEEKFCASYPCGVAFFDPKNDCCPKEDYSRE